MLVMGKKKPAEEASPDRGPQILFRPYDERIIAALDAFARSVKRSRNNAMLILLEEALRSHGFWPPAG